MAFRHSGKTEGDEVGGLVDKLGKSLKETASRQSSCKHGNPPTGTNPSRMAGEYAYPNES